MENFTDMDPDKIPLQEEQKGFFTRLYSGIKSFPAITGQVVAENTEFKKVSKL